MKYLIDTSSLIDINRWYSMILPEFAFIWDKIGTAVGNLKLSSIFLVKNELKDKEIKEFFKKYHEFYLNPNLEEQEEVAVLIERYPKLIKLRSTKNSDADIFLIAIAKNRDFCVVTSEKFAQSKQNIPGVCKMENIKCIDTNKFVTEVLLRW